ncbi:dynein regulatory complex subunit 2-like [Chrysoperla carnea]|uniref:dynein regulatory complex subunit 2-like n=1 Tax=Chrysoperla carnea TaxID=189513 RepID=UPI001D0827B8|nr:dynein regulatory complex subunit 2-like [Chrysoperla carnea]
MGKLTKEEKKALKEAKKQQRLFEAEMARRQREMDHLERELGFTRRSQQLMNKKFRDELMKIAIKKFRENAETAWAQFNKAIDCKDYAISLKLEEVDQSSEQHMTNFTGHAEQIDKFLHLLQGRIGDLRQQYSDDLRHLTSISTEIFNQIKQHQFETDEYLRRMVYQLDVGGKNLIKNLDTEHQNKMDVEDNKASEVTEHIHIDLERKMDVYWTAYKDTLNAYAAHVDERKSEYKRLIAQDSKNSAHISKQIDKTAFLFDRLRRLKERAILVEGEQRAKVTDLSNERKIYADTFVSLRNRLIKARRTDTNALTILSEECNTTIDYLRNLYKKGEHLLNAATVCLKLEKQQEKVLPFRYYEYNKERASLQENESLTLKSKYSLPEMEQFFSRVGQVNIDRIALQEEREHLKRENRLLRKKIQDYYDSAAYVNPYLDPPKPRHKYKKCHGFQLSPINIINAADIVNNLL